MKAEINKSSNRFLRKLSTQEIFARQFCFPQHVRPTSTPPHLNTTHENRVAFAHPKFCYFPFFRLFLSTILNWPAKLNCRLRAILRACFVQ